MQIPTDKQQAIYNAVRALLDIPGSHVVKVAEGKKELRKHLSSTVIFENKLPTDIIDIFMRAFITNQSALYYLQKKLKQSLQASYIEKSTAEDSNKKARLTDNSTEEYETQEVKHDTTVVDFEDLMSRLSTQIAALNQDLEIAERLYEQESQISKETFNSQQCLKFFFFNKHTPTLMLDYLKCKAYALIKELDFVILASGQEIVQAATEYLHYSTAENHKNFVEVLKTHTNNGLLPLSIITFIATSLPKNFLLTPQDNGQDDHIDMEWLYESMESVTQLDKSKLDFVRRKIIELGFEFEQSRLNSRASSPAPATSISELAEPIMPTPDQTPEPEAPAVVSSSSAALKL